MHPIHVLVHRWLARIASPRCLVLLALVGGWSAAAHAQTLVTWDGGGANTNWTTGTNWIGDTAPVAGNALVFSGLTQQSTNNDFVANTTFFQIKTSTGGFTLAGNPVKLNTGGGVFDVDNTGNNTISMALETANSANTLYIYGRSGTLTLSGSVSTLGTLQLNSEVGGGNIIFTGKVHGSGGIQTLVQSSTVTLANDNSGFTGGITLQRGGLKLDNPNALGATSNSVLVQRVYSNTSFGTLDFNGQAVGAKPITFNVGSGAADSFGGGLVGNWSGTDASLSGPVSMPVAGFFGGTGVLTLSGTISGSALVVGGANSDLNKTNSGMLVLANASDNTYVGATIISGGTLSISRAGHLGTVPGTARADSIQLSNGSTLRTTASLGLAANRGVTLGSGGGRFDVTSGTLGVAGAVSGAGALTKLGSGTLTLSASNSYSGGTTLSAGTLLLGGSNSLGSTSAALTVNGGTLDFGGATVSVGTLSGAGGTIALGGGSLTATMGSNEIFSGAITGTGGFTKAGGVSTVLTLSGSSTYTGATTIDGGRIYLGASNALPVTTVLAFSGSSSDRRFDLMGFGQTLAGLDTSPSTGGLALVEAAFDGQGNLPATLTLNVASGTSYTYNSIIRDAPSVSSPSPLSLTKTGGGTQVLSGGSGLVTYSGPTTINGGVLEFAGGSNVANSSAITLGGGTAQFSGGGTRSNTIAGTGGLEKTGANTLTLTGSNTYAGLTTVSGGTLQIGSGGTAGLLGSGTVALTSTGNIVFNRSDALTVNNTFTWSGTSNAGGYLTHSGAGTLALEGNQSLCGLVTTAGAGAVTVSGGTLTLGNASGAQFQSRLEPAAGTTITVTSAVAPALAESGVGFLYVGKPGAAAGITALGNASAVTYGSVVLNVGTLDIVGTLQNTLKSKRLVFENNTAGASVIQLSGSLTSPIGSGSGNVQVSTGADAGFAARTAPASINIGGSGAGLTYGQSLFLASGRTLYFGSPTADNVVTFQNPLNLAGATQTINVVDNAGSAGDAAVLSGVLSNGGLTKTGAGRLSLAANNTYTGLTTISAGTLSIGSGGTAGAVAGGILNNAALVFDRSDALSFSGTIGGSGGLTKQGAGTLTLAGNSSYAGTTAVDVGGLLVDGALSGVGLTSVANGARVGGDGSLAGALTLLSGAQFIFNPSATLDVTGAVTLDNSFSVFSLVAADGSSIDWSSVATGTYTLIGTTSTFANILNFGVGNAANIGGDRTAYFQNGSLQLVIVPEPGAFALAGLGIAAAAWARRRRR